MYGDKIFIRTPEGNDALSNRELLKLGYKVHMVLNLCDGKSRYHFLESNLKRVDNLPDIIEHLLENNLITELNNESKQRFLSSKNSRQKESPKVQEPQDIEAELDNAFSGNPKTSSNEPSQQDFIKAISVMNDALSEFFSDEVLEWSMQAESCSNPDEMELLIARFEKIYAKNSSRGKANDVINKVRQVV